jgi:hypothetical protein
MLFVIYSWHWPFVGDAPLIHYVVFLIEHSFVPYRQITDLNLPGTLAVEAAVMTLIGKGALAWRIFDLLLLAAIGLGMFVVCTRRNAFAAILAASTFALIHGRDGLIQLGQRDLSMAAFLVATYACLALVVRAKSSEHPTLSLVAGLCCGVACSIKPDAILLPPFLFFFFTQELQRQNRLWRRHLLAAGVGLSLPLVASVAFLAQQHALSAFILLMVHLAPYHASLWRLPDRTLLSNSVSSVLCPFFLAWLVLFFVDKRWKTYTDQVLLAGFLFGIFSFYLQGRGYPYHR